MSFKLHFTEQADRGLDELENNPAQQKRLKSVRKALGYLQTNPRHPGHNTHEFNSLIGPKSEDVFEAYAENNTPGAYRIFWFYGSGKNAITIIAITPVTPDSHKASNAGGFDALNARQNQSTSAH